MIIRVENNLSLEAPVTFLTNAVSIGASSLPVKNLSQFSASWGVQIGSTGEEQSEVKILSASTPSGTALSLTGTTTFEHPADTPVYGIKFDQVVFLRSTSGTSGTATALTGGTVTITPDSAYTLFDDTSGAVTYAYRAKFRNSVTTDESSLSDWLTPSGYSFYSLARLRERIRGKFRNSSFIEDSDIDDWINEWKDELTNSAIKINQDYNIGTVDVAFGTSGYGTITATDFASVRRLQVTYDGVNYYTSTRKTITDIFPNQIYNNTHPYHNYFGDTVFQIHPSDQSGTARIVYYKLNEPLNDETDELPVPMRGFTKSFVDYGESQGLYLDGKDSKAQLKENSANRGKSLFIASLTPRDQTGPTYIQEIEPIAGEDGGWL